MGERRRFPSGTRKYRASIKSNLVGLMLWSNSSVEISWSNIGSGCGEIFLFRYIQKFEYWPNIFVKYLWSNIMEKYSLQLFCQRLWSNVLYGHLFRNFYLDQICCQPLWSDIKYRHNLKILTCLPNPNAGRSSR